MALQEFEVDAQILGPERRCDRGGDVGKRRCISGCSLAHDPTRNTLVRLSNAAITDSAVTRPVPGFSGVGTFSMVISKRALSASTLIAWVLRFRLGSAQISSSVRSGPMPASA